MTLAFDPPKLSAQPAPAARNISQLPPQCSRQVPSARFAARFGPLFQNNLHQSWKSAEFARGVFSLHQLSPLERPAHNLGGGVIWGRNYFGDSILAELAARQQVGALLPFDRKEAALFGLAARPGSKAPAKIVSIGAEASARAQGLARISWYLGAKFALFEPSDVALSKFLFELRLNGLSSLDLSIGLSPVLSPSPKGGGSDPDSSLASYLRARGALRCGRQLKAALSGDWPDLIADAHFVFIEPAHLALQLAIGLLPQLDSECPIVLRAAPKSISALIDRREERQLRRLGREIFSLPEGQRQRASDLATSRSVLWLALVATKSPALEFSR